MNMRVVCAFDKFKGTASADAIGQACARGFGVNAHVQVIPMADGGEGFVNAFSQSPSFEKHELDGMQGPLPQERFLQNVPLLISKDRSKPVLILESASACGLCWVPSAQRNPMETTSYGVGQALRKALTLYFPAAEAPLVHVVLGLGGTATSDGGVAILQALGAKILLRSASSSSDLCEELSPDVPFVGGMLPRLVDIIVKDTPAEAFLRQCSIDLASDVTNPFVGPHGAVHTFSAQKGSTPETRELLEQGMLQLARIIQRRTGVHVEDMLGAGAAGGIAGTLRAFFPQARIVPGVEIVAEVLHLEEAIQQADLVLTGEGSFDAQSERGKVVSHVFRLCQRHHKRCAVVCGVSDQPRRFSVEGIPGEVRVIALADRFSLEESMSRTVECVEQVVDEEQNGWIIYTSHE